MPQRMQQIAWARRQRRWCNKHLQTTQEVRKDASHMGHNHFEIGNLVKETTLDEANHVQATIVWKPQCYKEAPAGQAVVVRRYGGMKMDRDSQLPNVLDNGAEFRGIEQLVRDIGEHLDAFQPQLVDAAVHFRDARCRSPNPMLPNPINFPG